MAKSRVVTKRCFYCGNRLSRKNHTVDHFVPLSKGGADKKHNKVDACNTCNTEKGCLLPCEFRAVIAYREWIKYCEKHKFTDMSLNYFDVPFYGEKELTKKRF